MPAHGPVVCFSQRLYDLPAFACWYRLCSMLCDLGRIRQTDFPILTVQGAARKQAGQKRAAFLAYYSLLNSGYEDSIQE